MTIVVSNILQWARQLLVNLLGSVTSVNFYKKVFKEYDGYGIQYVANISIIASVLSTIFMLHSVSQLNLYAKTKQPNNYTFELDYLLNQLPKLYYQNGILRTNIDNEDSITGTPLLLKNSKNKAIIAIDLDGQLTSTEKLQLPIIIGKTHASFLPAAFITQSKPAHIEQINYASLLGSGQIVLTKKNILDWLQEYTSTLLPKICIYVLFPIISLFTIPALLAEQIVTIFLFFFTINLVIVQLFKKQKTGYITLKQCTRLVLFASAPNLALMPIILFLAPSLHIVLSFLQIWTNFLMVIAMAQTLRKV